MGLGERWRELIDDTGRFLTLLGIGGSVSAVIAAAWYYGDELATLPGPVQALLVLAGLVLFLLLNAFGVLLSHVYFQRPRENPFRPQAKPQRVELASTEDLLRKQLVDRTQEVEKLTSDVERAKSQGEAAIQAYQTCSRNYTLLRFSQFAEKNPSLQVKIRCAGYADWSLVEKIQNFSGNTRSGGIEGHVDCKE